MRCKTALPLIDSEAPVAIPQPRPAEFPQNYFANLACFSACENDRQATTIYHPIHHNFTTKTPRKNSDFSNTPSKNAPQNTKNRSFPAPENFSEIKRFRMTKWTGRVNG